MERFSEVSSLETANRLTLTLLNEVRMEYEELPKQKQEEPKGHNVFKKQCNCWFDLKRECLFYII